MKIQNKDYVAFIDAEEGTCHFKDRIFLIQYLEQNGNTIHAILDYLK
ncbi:hypothetical protein CHCC20333_1635 [Bacillus paralicheniformis]|nr:hypothetical protein CHCC20333_1635 [Bacillus paralicheniformis]